jgi:hypothetical protein
MPIIAENERAITPHTTKARQLRNPRNRIWDERRTRERELAESERRDRNRDEKRAKQRAVFAKILPSTTIVQCTICKRDFTPHHYYTREFYEEREWYEYPNGVLMSTTGESSGALVTPHGAHYCNTCADEVICCRVCGCTDENCSGCIEKTGAPCHWVALDLCSACAPTPNMPKGEMR